VPRVHTADVETTRAGSPISFPDIRVAQADEAEGSFLALGRTYRFDEAHGRQVARLALALFDQLQPLHGLDEPDRRLLQAAGILHDIGISVSFRRHHKHSLDLISRSDLPGFTPRQILLVANVARYHRRSAPKPGHAAYAALAAEDQRRVVRLAAILRLADVLDRDHRQAVRRVRTMLRDGRLGLRVEAEGEILVDRTALARKADLFQKTFGVPVEFLARERTTE
jgi:exopolyphosphatase / guanosine-5'-triphosphate,3'-diphosphate pyrophosphatase